MSKDSHAARVRKELRESGLIPISFIHLTSGYIPTIIRPDEHIKAAVYGHHRTGVGIFGYEVGLLIATDKRILYIVHRPGFTTMDEMNRDYITGVTMIKAGIFASVTLYTRLANYVISFARPKAAKHFVETVERMSVSPKQTTEESTIHQAPVQLGTSNGTVDFMRSHCVGVLSSVEKSGGLSGAAVFYIMMDNFIYFMTKSGTKKAENLITYHNVAFTVYDQQTLQTVQIQGAAEIEQDATITDTVATTIGALQSKTLGKQQPPITKLSGQANVYKITPSKISFIDYSTR